MTSDLAELTINEAARLLRLHSISAADLVTAHVERIERIDRHVKAYLRFTPELWEKQAAEADRRLKWGDAGPLAGIPMAVKDVLCVRGVETTAGSQILRGFKPPYTGTAVSRLLKAGAVMLGVTNCDEFAMGSSTENSGYHPTHNPWDLDRVPGGSSGGSAAGWRMEPPVSVPSATIASPEATAAALPPELPPGTRSKSQGLCVG